MNISVDLLWFGSIYHTALAQLREIDRIYRTPVDIGELSDTIKEYLVEDEHLHNTLVALLNGMVSDWKATFVCVSNLTHFDSYVSHLINHESTGHMEYGCDALWRDGNVNDSSFVAQTNAHFDSSNGNYISSRSINNLDLLCNKFEDTAIAISRYITLVDRVINKEDFSGTTIDGIKRYMTGVHIPVARSLVTLMYAFISNIRSYQDLYSSTMSGESINGEYFIDVESIQSFKGQITQSYRSLRSKISDFNQYVWSMNSVCEEFNLEAIANYTLDNVEALVNTRISRVEEIIINNERSGLAGVDEIRSYIDSLDNVVADLGVSTGYRMIYPNRQFDSISPLENMRVQGPDVSIFDQLLSGSSSERANAAASFRNTILDTLIGWFIDRKEYPRYYYNMYQGYDDDVLKGDIERLELTDIELICTWRKLYNSMLASGYSELNALRFSEIAVLFNLEGIRSCNDIPGNQDEIVINGIRNYVTSYYYYIANNSAYGYNQTNRWGTFNDFDCGSLILAGYEKAFIDLRYAIDNENPVAQTLSRDITTFKPYGFHTYIPNIDLKLEDLVPGDIFTIYKKEEETTKINGIGHVEAFLGKVENNGRTEYLNVSAHSSEQINGGDDSIGAGGDQLQSTPSLLRPECDSREENYYYNLFCREEEGRSFIDNPNDPNFGKDSLGNDRVNEIRVENIGPRDNWPMGKDEILGYVYWERVDDKYPVIEKWDKILRLEEMDYWKQVDTTEYWDRKAEEYYNN